MKQVLSDYGRGAAVATALVNTATRVRDAGEQLDGPDALTRFLVESGIPSEAPRSASDLREVHALRTRVRDLIEVADADRLAVGANALLGHAAVSLERDGSGAWQWVVRTDDGAPPAEQLAVVVGVGLLGTLRALGSERVRACADPTCDGLFVDTSKAGRRRYCTPELCGNRVNVARFRERRSGRDDGTP